MSVKLSFFELDQTFNIGKREVNQSKKKTSLGAKGCYVVKAVCYMVQAQLYCGENMYLHDGKPLHLHRGSDFSILG